MDQDLKMMEPAGDSLQVDVELLEQTSLPFVGRWNELVSHTNWEKGRIIHQWRETLRASGAPATEYSDDAWSRRVGGVTGQHVGRLRRVYQRFGASHADYAALFWSHFQAAIDWEDAEMWLEGAVQNRWSVTQMRHQRWETLGALDEPPPSDEVISSELDEDFAPDTGAGVDEVSRTVSDVQTGPREEGPDFGDEEALDSQRGGSAQTQLPRGSAETPDALEASQPALVRPFANLTELPDDLSAAFDAFKLAILHHKLDNWQQIACEDVLASLDALKQLATAP
ncbi:MAG: hypothetical protein GXY58_08790 [Planctomycetaceae bacterium]|nr:hypothetical protein [Planctomycetaceae bacterium]